jgi:molybdopterin-containing oxidoreductase family iron-sulfur binding subunit
MSNTFFKDGDDSTGEAGKSSLNRRSFLKASAGAAAALAAAAGVAAPLRNYSGGIDFDSFFQDHYTRLTPEMMAEILAEIEEKIGREYGAKVSVRDPKPLDGVEYGYALNLTRCNGSRRCVSACVEENNHSRDPEMQYIKVLEIPNGSFNIEQGNLYYDRDEVPAKESYYLPVQCHQCQEPPCTKVCPVEATWQEPDGITVVDYDWCIGCRYCMAACPYEARRFTYSKPTIRKEEINPNMGYLSNRIRPREGKNPACLEVCPTGARIFGNLRDKNSEIRKILADKRVYILKEEAGTKPRFFYYFDT